MKIKNILIVTVFGLAACKSTRLSQSKPESNPEPELVFEDFEDWEIADTDIPEAVPPALSAPADTGKSKVVYEMVEIMPEFPGGEDSMRAFIKKNFKYPEEARRFSIEGRTFIVFIVNQDGKISDIKPLLPPERQLGYGLEEEAMRVVSIMPDWKPGMQRGKPVNVRYTIPIYILQK